MSAVIDSSVLVAALTDFGPDGRWAEEIVAGGELHAPDIVRAEATNTLRRLELERKIGTPDANGAFDDLMQLALELHPYDPFSGRIWELRHNVMSYDAWYVAIAEALALPLATLDKRLARASGVRCKFLTRP